MIEGQHMSGTRTPTKAMLYTKELQWNAFVSGKELQRISCSFLGNVPDLMPAAREQLLSYISEYRKNGSGSRAVIDSLLLAHEGYCQKQPAGTVYTKAKIRRHRILELRIREGLYASQIARKLDIRINKADEDISEGIRELTKICIGWPGLAAAGGSRYEVMERILKGYPVLSETGTVSIEGIFSNEILEPVRYWRAATIELIRILDQAIDLYGEYTAGADNPVEERRLAVLKASFISDCCSREELVRRFFVDPSAINRDRIISIHRLKDLILTE